LVIRPNDPRFFASLRMTFTKWAFRMLLVKMKARRR
jgi:hypothetical protein